MSVGLCVSAGPGWEEILAGPRPRRHARLWLWLSRVLCAAGVVLVAAAPVLACWPYVEQAYNARVQSIQAREVVSQNSPQTAGDLDQLARAVAYNAGLLASGQPVLGEVVDPFDGSTGDFSGSDDAAYMDALSDDPDGVMAVVEIPSIGVELPVRHGSSQDVLERGAGHLHGTSLPVGGEGTHAVITAHRGLRDKLMFTRLDELEAGDLVYVRVEGETLAYTVDRISVVDPDDVAGLRAVAGEDRLTLMTCTPYGVNTQRLLVSGTRSMIPFEAPDPDDAPGDPVAVARDGALVALVVVAVGWSMAGVWRLAHRSPGRARGVPPRHGPVSGRGRYRRARA